MDTPYQAAIWLLGSQYVTVVDEEVVYSVNLDLARQAAYNLILPKVSKRAALVFRPIELEIPANMAKVVVLKSSGDIITGEWHDLDQRFYVGGAAQDPSIVKGWDLLPAGLTP